jgi:RHS repeat-associated protein
MTELDNGDAAVWFAHNHYQYDNVGREVARWRDEDGNKGERFWFNPANEITRAVYHADNVSTGNPSNWNRFRDYNYTPDLLNWTSVNDNGYLAPLGHNDLNQYTGINGFVPQYDGNFNQTTSYYGQTFAYNAQNQLVDGSMQATYDGLGRCVRRTVSGVTTLFTYDDWNPVTEWDGAGNWRGWTIYGAKADEVLLRYDAIYGPQVYKHDNQGSVTFILDGPTHVAEKYSYDVYGRPTIMDGAGNVHSQTAIGNRYMYTGREWIADLQVYDYRHRFYNPDTGRFLQTDPTGFDAGDMNLFRYCDDDPVDRSDPSGLIATDWTWSRLMWEQGSSSYGFNDLYQSYVNAGASGSAATVTGMPTREANIAPKSDTPTSDTTKSMQMTIAIDPATGQPKFEDGGYHRIYSVQLANADGKPQDGRGWYAQEEIKVRVNQCTGPGCHDGKFDVLTSNGKPLYELPRSGQARDRVGPLNPPKHNTSGNIIKDQRWWLQHGTEQKYLLPGVLRQTTTVNDGKSLNSIAPTSVPWD